MSTPLARATTAELFDRYARTFATRDVAAIAALHAPDGRFVLRTGQEPVVGRDAVAAAFADLFVRWPELGFVTRRVVTGPEHWVLDWDLTARLGGVAVRFGCLDVVELDRDGLVLVKETWIDATEAATAVASARAAPPAS